MKDPNDNDSGIHPEWRRNPHDGNDLGDEQEEFKPVKL
jgi:hypothetical protein